MESLSAIAAHLEYMAFEIEGGSDFRNEKAAELRQLANDVRANRDAFEAKLAAQ